MITLVPRLLASYTFIELIEDRAFGQAAAGAKTAVIAKRASTDGNRAIDVGAGKASIDAYSLDAMPKKHPQVIIIGVITQSFGAPVEMAAGIAGFEMLV